MRHPSRGAVEGLSAAEGAHISWDDLIGWRSVTLACEISPPLPDIIREAHRHSARKKPL